MLFMTPGAGTYGAAIMAERYSEAGCEQCKGGPCFLSITSWERWVSGWYLREGNKNPAEDIKQFLPAQKLFIASLGRGVHLGTLVGAQPGAVGLQGCLNKVSPPPPFFSLLFKKKKIKNVQTKPSSQQS